MTNIDCKKYAQVILDAARAVTHKKRLVILTAGDNAASESYVKGKIRDCEYCGIPYQHIRVNAEDQLGWAIWQSARDPMVGGIIVQLPLPDGWDEDYFTNLVPKHLDVDGFQTGSLFKPCTPEGIMYLLRKELGDLSGKKVLLVGKGKLVGRPLINMLIDHGCTLTIAHSRTRDLDELTWSEYDVAITATGIPHLVNLQRVWADVVIDAGVNRNANGKLCGDCYGTNEWSRVTPVPGGVGLMTRAVLMAHMAGLEVDKL